LCCNLCKLNPQKRIYCTWSKTRLIENIFTLTPALAPTLTLTLTLTLKRNYVFGLTKWRHFSNKCNDTPQNNNKSNLHFYNVSDKLRRQSISVFK